MNGFFFNLKWCAPKLLKTPKGGSQKKYQKKTKLSVLPSSQHFRNRKLCRNFRIWLRRTQKQKFKIKSTSTTNVFPNMFPIAPKFYLIWFDKCCPSFTYKDGPIQGRTVKHIFPNRTFNFEESPCFQNFFVVTGQSSWLSAKQW
jgi:hypothetical protein